MIGTINDFGLLLGQFRKQKGITQVALARACGYDPSYVSRLERGARRPPDREMVIALCDALGLTDAESEQMLLTAGYAPKSVPGLDAARLLRVPALERIEAILLDPELPDVAKRVIVHAIEDLARLVDALSTASPWRRERRQSTLHPSAELANGRLAQRRFRDPAVYKGAIRTAEAVVEYALNLSRQQGARSSTRGQLHPAYALLGLGVAYRYWGQLATAEEYLVDALKMWEMKGDKLNAAQTMVALGDVYRATADWERAAAWYGRATTELLRLGADSASGEQRLLFAQSLWARARVSLAMGDPTAAGRQLSEAMATGEVVNSPWAMEVCSQLLGQMEEALGHFQAARGRYQESLQYSERVGHWHRRAETLLMLGRVCLQTDEAAQALECAKMAQNLVSREEGGAHLLARVHQLRAQCYLTAGNHMRAVEQYGEAVAWAASYHESLRREMEHDIIDNVTAVAEADREAASTLVTGLLATWRSMALDQYGGLEFVSLLLAIVPQPRR